MSDRILFENHMHKVTVNGSTVSIFRQIDLASGLNEPKIVLRGDNSLAGLIHTMSCKIERSDKTFTLEEIREIIFKNVNDKHKCIQFQNISCKPFVDCRKCLLQEFEKAKE